MPDLNDPILDLSMGENGAGAATIREYLFKLLYAVWVEGEGFKGKRPFGDSGWEYDIYTTLVTHGVVPGEVDEDGYLDTFDDEDAANKIVIAAIRRVFGYE